MRGSEEERRGGEEWRGIGMKEGGGELWRGEGPSSPPQATTGAKAVLVAVVGGRDSKEDEEEEVVVFLKSFYSLGPHGAGTYSSSVEVGCKFTQPADFAVIGKKIFFKKAKFELGW